MHALILHSSFFIFHYFAHLSKIIDTPLNRATLPALIFHFSLSIIHCLPHFIVKIRKKNIKKTYLSDNLNIFAIDKSPKSIRNLRDCIHFIMTIKGLCAFNLLK